MVIIQRTFLTIIMLVLLPVLIPYWIAMLSIYLTSLANLMFFMFEE